MMLSQRRLVDRIRPVAQTGLIEEAVHILLGGWRARMEDKQCLFVIIGADKFGNKELLSIEDGFRESEQS